MQRLRLYDARISRLPSAIGLCSSDITGIAQFCNSAERRLIESAEAGDEGWYGTFAEIAFFVSRTTPYVTMPRGVARIEAATVCDHPVDVNNQFYEYLRFGNGRMPKQFLHDHCNFLVDVLSRNNAPTFKDLTPAPQFIKVYPVDPADNGKRVLVQGLDTAGNQIYSQDGQQQAKGLYVTVQVPSAVVLLNGAPMPYSRITGIQKDVTAGQIQIFQVDPTTGAEVLIHTMEPGETTGWYRRYFFNNLPLSCCPVAPQTVPAQIQITAICKLDPIPVTYDTDYFTLQSLEALIEESQAIRYGDMDVVNAKGFEKRHHDKAIGLLNGQLAHIYGKQTPAVNFAPFGSAKLERLNIGMV